MEKLAAVIATFFGAGKFPFASGTAGTVAAIPLILLVHHLTGSPGVIAFAVLSFFAGIWASQIYIGISGDNDPKPVVIDEVAGMAIAVSFLPVGITEYAVAFVFFRFFDVTKVWPANWAEKRLSGGLAVMLDDVIAGLYAGVAAVILMRFLP